MRSKYNVRTDEIGKVNRTMDNILFASLHEMFMYSDLKKLRRAGKIKKLILQPTYTLIPAYTNATGRTIRKLTYRPDFKFYDVDQKKTRILDAKGRKTEVFNIKKKMFEYKYKSSGFIIEELI